MNKTWLIGNLTRDPELSKTSRGTSICRFTIAVNRPYMDSNGERETDFFDCTAWNGTAENIAKYCAKGSKVAVVGSIQMRTYEDNRGNRRTAVDVIVQEVEFLAGRERKNVAENGASAKRNPAPEQLALENYDDDIPF